MNANIGLYPSSFDKNIINAIETVPSAEIDQKIYIMIGEKGLFEVFTSWIAKNTHWGKEHTMLVHDIMMLSLEKRSLKNIQLIETIASSIWNQSTKNIIYSKGPRIRQEALANELKEAIENKNKILICLLLFKHLEYFLYNDLNFIKKCLEELSDNERAGFVYLKNEYKLNPLQICVKKHNLEIFNLFLKAVPKNERNNFINTRYSSEKNLINMAINCYNNGPIIKKVIKSIPKSERIVPVKSIIADLGFQLFTRKDGVGLIKAVIKPLFKNDKIEIMMLQNQYGEILLNFAIRYRLEKVIKELLSLFSKEEAIVILEIPNDGLSAIQWAIWCGNSNIIKILLDSLPKIYENRFAEIAEELIEKHPIDKKMIISGISTLIPDQISHLLPKFKIKLKQNKIYLLGKNPNFLIKKWELIAEYTSKIDPVVKIKECHIKEVTNEEDLKCRFTHRVAIHHILPRPVRHCINSPHIDSNCHGFARVASGVSSKMQFLDTPESDSIVQENTQYVKFEIISSGDWVYLEEGPECSDSPGKKGAHSFVFLSHTFCLSMNGSGNPSGFYSTKEILKMYGYPTNILKTIASQIELRKHIIIFRKNVLWHYPEEYM